MLDTLANDKLIPSKSFMFDLRSTPAKSSLTLGGVDKTHAKGDFD